MQHHPTKQNNDTILLKQPRTNQTKSLKDMFSNAKDTEELLSQTSKPTKHYENAVRSPIFLSHKQNRPKPTETLIIKQKKHQKNKQKHHKTNKPQIQQKIPIKPMDIPHFPQVYHFWGIHCCAGRRP